MISRNIAIVREKVEKAARKCGRDPSGIKIICVTKGRMPEEIKDVIRCGVKEIGENRVQEAVAKYRSFALDTKVSRAQDDRVHWHMIGHLQTNKVKDAVRIFDIIHSLDSLKLAKEIDKEAARINKVQDALIEVNTSGEAAKFGVAPDGLMDLVKEIISLRNINLLGLMTIAPAAIVRGQTPSVSVPSPKEEARPYFKKLRELKNELNEFLVTSQCGAKRSLPEGGKSVWSEAEPPRRGQVTSLSMGMSQDYEVAVEEGATMVRIGTAIFEG